MTIIGVKILFLARPSVKADPKIPIDIKIGVPISKVINITKESSKDISKRSETNGMNKIIGRQVNSQHAMILKNKINSTPVLEVKYISITPLL